MCIQKQKKSDRAVQKRICCHGDLPSHRTERGSGCASVEPLLRERPRDRAVLRIRGPGAAVQDQEIYSVDTAAEGQHEEGVQKALMIQAHRGVNHHGAPVCGPKIEQAGGLI